MQPFSLNQLNPIGSGTDPYQYLVQQQQAQASMQLANQQAIFQQQAITGMLAGATQMAGRQMTPQMAQFQSSMAGMLAPTMTAGLTGGVGQIGVMGANFAGFGGIVNPIAQSVGVQSPIGRTLLDMTSPTGMAPINIAAPLHNAMASHVDPFSGRMASLDPTVQQQMTSRIIGNMLRRPEFLDPQNTPMGAMAASGFDGRQIGEAIYHLERRGELQSMHNIIAEYSSPVSIAYQQSGRRSLFTDQTGMTPTERIGESSLTLDPSSMITPSSRTLAELRRTMGVDGPIDMNALYNEYQNLDPQRVRRRVERALGDSDNVARDRITERLESVAELENDRRLDLALATGEIGHREHYRLKHGVEDIPWSATPGIWFNSAMGIAADFNPLAGAFNETIEEKLKDPVYAEKVIKGFQTSFPEMKGMEFDQRLLNLASAAGSRVGAIDNEAAEDLTAAYKAAMDDDKVAYEKTVFGNMQPEERIEYVSQFTGLSPEAVANAMRTFGEERLADMAKENRKFGPKDDPFAAKEASDAMMPILEELQNTPAMQTRQGLYAAMTDDISRNLKGQLEMLGAVKDLVTDPDLQDNMGALLGIADEILQGAGHQMGGEQRAQSVRRLVTLAQQNGLNHEGLAALSGVSSQMTSAAGLESAFNPSVTEQMLLGEQVYGSRGLAVNQLGIFGMRNAAQMAQADAAAFTETMNSENANAVGTVLRLRERADGNAFSGGESADFLNRVAEQAIAGNGEGPELLEFMSMDGARRRALLRNATGETDSFIQDEMSLGMANRRRLNQDLSQGAVTAANRRVALESRLAPALSRLTDDVFRNTGMRGEAGYENFVRSSGGALLKAMQNMSPQRLAAVERGDELNQDMLAHAVYGNLGDRGREALENAFAEAGMSAEERRDAAIGALRDRFVPGVLDRFAGRTGSPLTGVVLPLSEDAANLRGSFDERNRGLAMARQLFSSESESVGAILNKIARGEISGIADLGKEFLGVNKQSDAYEKLNEVESMLQASYESMKIAGDEGGDMSIVARQHAETIKNAMREIDNLKVANPDIKNKMDQIEASAEAFMSGGGSGSTDGKVGDLYLENASVYLDGKKVISGASGGTKRGSRGSRSDVAT